MNKEQTIHENFKKYAHEFRRDMKEVSSGQWANADYYLIQSNNLHKFIEEFVSYYNDESIDKIAIKSWYTLSKVIYFGYVILFSNYKNVDKNFISINFELSEDIING